MSKTERRKAEARLQALLALSDVAALLTATILAYLLRFHSPLTHLVPATKGVPSLHIYIEAALVLAAAWLPTFAALGLYRPRLGFDFLNQLRAGTRGVAIGTLIAFGLTFFYRGESFSRLTLAIAVGILVVLVPGGRVLVGRIARRFRPVSGVAIVGSGDMARALAERLAAFPEPGTQLIGRFAAETFGDDEAPGDDARAGSLLRPEGSLAAVVDLVRAGDVDRVLLVLGLEESNRAPAIIAVLEPYAVEIEWVPDLLGLAPGRARLEEVVGMPALVLGEFPLLGWNGAVKRAMDLSLSLIGLVVLAPLLATIALLVKASGPGPVIYRQERVGRDGRRFQMLKFRSMEPGAETGTGPIFARPSDPRVTALGRFLRRSSLDELPQLVNVWRGEMSLVGPRPERPCFVDDLAGQIPTYLHRLRVKSGMTGWAQIHGLRGAESSMTERVLCDLYYIENWSVALDLRILFRTLLTIYRQHNAY